MPDFDLFIAHRTVASMEGQQVSFSDDDLRGIAERYDPALHEAPLIVGHPKHDAPAFGWVKGLSFADGRLQAVEHQVDAAFAAARDKGRIKKVSARFFSPDSPNNPTPGHYYLRDVGFLGALTPAVKGLRTYSFGDDTADQVLPAYELEALREISQRAAETPTDPDTATAPALRSFADDPDGRPPAPTQEEQSPMTDADKAELEAARQKAAALEAENATLKAAQREAANAQRHADNLSFADGLVAAGRWPSGNRDVLVATLDHLSEPADDGCVSFGDGDAAEPLHAALRKGLQEMPLLVSFGDVATKAKAAGAGKGKSDREVADAARAWKDSEAQAGRHVSFADAVKHITTEEATA